MGVDAKTREEILAMIDDGSFIPYKKSFINMMFDMNEASDRNMFTITSGKR